MDNEDGERRIGRIGQRAAHLTADNRLVGTLQAGGGMVDSGKVVGHDCELSRS